MFDNAFHFGGNRWLVDRRRRGLELKDEDV